MAVSHSERPLRAFRAPAAHLELQHQVQSMLPQRVDGVHNQRYNNVNAIWLMLGYTRLEKSKGWSDSMLDNNKRNSRGVFSKYASELQLKHRSEPDKLVVFPKPA